MIRNLTELAAVVAVGGAIAMGCTSDPTTPACDTADADCPDAGCPTTGCPTDGCPTAGCPTDGCPTAGCPTDGCPTAGCPTDGCPTAGCPTDGCPTAGCPTDGCPTAGCPTDGCPTAGCPTDGCPTAGCPTDGCPTAGCPTDGCPTAGCPTDGCPTAGCPTDGCPTDGCPTDGCPTTNSGVAPSAPNGPAIFGHLNGANNTAVSSTVYFSGQLEPSIALGGSFTAPIGSTTIEERHNTAGAITGYTVMTKRSAGYDPYNGDWHYELRTASGAVQAQGRIRAIASFDASALSFSPVSMEAGNYDSASVTPFVGPTPAMVSGITITSAL